MRYCATDPSLLDRDEGPRMARRREDFRRCAADILIADGTQGLVQLGGIDSELVPPTESERDAIDVV